MKQPWRICRYFIISILSLKKINLLNVEHKVGTFTEKVSEFCFYFKNSPSIIAVRVTRILLTILKTQSFYENQIRKTLCTNKCNIIRITLYVFVQAYWFSEIWLWFLLLFCLRMTRNNKSGPVILLTLYL